MTQITDKDIVILFDDIFEAVPGNHLILKPNPPVFTLLAVSENYTRVTLTRKEEIIGRSLFDVFPDNPDDPNANGVRNLNESLLTVLATRKEHRMKVQKYDIPRPDREGFEEKYWSPVNKPVLNEKGEVEYIIHTVVDVTENIRLQQMERIASEHARISNEKAYLLFGQAPVAIAIFTGPDHIIEFVNNSHLKIWDKTLDEVINMPYLKALPELKGSSYEEFLRDVYTTGRPYSANEHSILLRRKGKIQWVWFSFIYQPVRNQEGKITGVIVAASEVTDLIESRNKLKQSNQELLQTNQELEQFAYSASHDLREPLRKIQIISDLVQTREASCLSEHGKKYLDKIMSAANKMEGLIQDLMEYAKNSRHVKNPQQTDLNEILNSVKRDLEPGIIEINARLMADKLPTIEAIPIQMHQLFLNIINNSLRFRNPDKELLIQIKCKKLSLHDSLHHPNLNPDKEYVEFEFSDNGVGFEQSYSNQVFYLFKRLSQNNGLGGNGVGLAICKKIVMNHKGLIEAESAPGRGTRILVTLPIGT